MFLSINNPTNDVRHGFVTVPWSMLRGTIDPNRPLMVKYRGRALTRVQLDRINLAGATTTQDSLWEVCVYVEYMEPGGYQTSNPLQIEVDSAPHSTPEPPQYSAPKPIVAVKVEDNDRRVTLSGAYLEAFLQLSAGPPNFDFQGGAFTSIRLRGREILDAFAAERHPSEGHDPYKRLQLDAV